MREPTAPCALVADRVAQEGDPTSWQRTITAPNVRFRGKDPWDGHRV